MIDIERTADYLRWVAPSIVVLVGYPIMLILACWLTAVITRRFLTKRYEIQDRPALQAIIHEYKADIVARDYALGNRDREIGNLKARIRENQALVSQLAMNYNIINTEERQS